MSKRARLFLETSGVIYQQHGHPLMVAAVQKAVENGLVVVSNFIRMEYIRGVVLNLIDLYFLIKLEDSVSNALMTWSQKVGQERKLKVVLMTIPQWICDQEGWQQVPRALRRLRETIVGFVRAFDTTFPGRAKDLLRCELGRVTFPDRPVDEEMLLRFRERFKAIKDGVPSCGLCAFKMRKQTELTRKSLDLYGPAQRETHKQYKGYVKQAEQLDRAAKSKDTQPKCTWCERLGDSIIILQAPPNAVLVTADRAFEAFGQILSREIRRLPSLAEMQRQAREEPEADSASTDE